MCPQCVAQRHAHCWAQLHAFDGKDDTPYLCTCDCASQLPVSRKQPTNLRVECGHCGRQDNLPAEQATIVVDLVMDSYYELVYNCRHCGGHNAGPLPADLGRQLVDGTHVQLAINEGGMA